MPEVNVDPAPKRMVSRRFIGSPRGRWTESEV
jgi:hypothetical protein